MERVLELDARKRVTLGTMVAEGVDRYLARLEEDGTVVLTPAAVVPAAQVRFMSDPDRVAHVSRALQERDRWVEVDDPELSDLLAVEE